MQWKLKWSLIFLICKMIKRHGGCCHSPSVTIRLSKMMYLWRFGVIWSSWKIRMKININKKAARQWLEVGTARQGGNGKWHPVFPKRQINSDMNTHTWGMHAWLTSPEINLQTLYGESNYKYSSVSCEWQAQLDDIDDVEGLQAKHLE